MKKSILATVAMLLLVAVTVLTTTAYAQPGGGGRGGRGPGGGPGGPGGPGMGPGGPGMAVLDEEFRTQLGLTEEQTQKMREAFRETFRQPQGGGGPGGDGPRQRPNREQMDQMRADMEKRQDEMQTKIKGILSTEQFEKYRVLSFQAAGGLDSPFLNEKLLDVVNLSDEQKAKIKAVTDERNEAFRKRMEENPIDWEKIRGMSEEDRRAFFEKRRTGDEEFGKKYREKITETLTAEQKEKAEKMTEGAKELREKMESGRRDRRGGERGEQRGEGREYRPGSDSWRPGQGARGEREGGRQRRAFPQSE